MNPTKLFSWSRLSLFVGPLDEATRHVHGAAAWCIALDGELGFAPGDAAFGRAQAVRIAPGVDHRLHGNGRPVAVLYVSPEHHRQVTRAIARPERLVSLLNDAYRSAPSRLATLESEVWAELERAGQSPRLDARARRASDLIRSQLDAPLRLAELADETGLSSERLRHVFRDQYGVNVRRYHVWHRCLAALTYAVQGASLTNAALELGFASSAHFSAQFRANFGIAPSSILRARGLEFEQFGQFGAPHVAAGT